MSPAPSTAASLLSFEAEDHHPTPGQACLFVCLAEFVGPLSEVEHKTRETARKGHATVQTSRGSLRTVVLAEPDALGELQAVEAISRALPLMFDEAINSESTKDLCLDCTLASILQSDPLWRMQHVRRVSEEEFEKVGLKAEECRSTHGAVITIPSAYNQLAKLGSRVVPMGFEDGEEWS